MCATSQTYYQLKLIPPTGKGGIVLTQKFDRAKLAKLDTANDMLDSKYGSYDTSTCEEFEAKAKVWYYAEVLKDARKAAGMTQQQLVDRIGKKREYVALIEKGETDMQLSTFIMISEALGLHFGLTKPPVAGRVQPKRSPWTAFRFNLLI